MLRPKRDDVLAGVDPSGAVFRFGCHVGGRSRDRGGAARARPMSYHRLAPRRPVDRIVDHYWLFENETMTAAHGQLFADGAADLMFDLGEPVLLHQHGRISRWAGAWVSGQRTAPIGVELIERQVTMAGVRLRPGGLAALLGAPASEAVDAIVELREFWRGFAGEALDRLATARGPRARLAALAAVVERRFGVSAAVAPPPSLAGALLMIKNEPRAVSVRALHERLGISHKHLTRLFHRHVGLTPKVYQRICRFRDLFDRLAVERGPLNWAGLALECGYTDQAHLCTEFRAFTGLTPTRYRRPPVPLPEYLPQPVV